MGDLADDINEVFSLQSSVFKAVETLEERTDPSRCARDVLLPPDALRSAHGIAFLWTYKVGVFLSFSAGNGLVMRRRVTKSNETQWSLPAAVVMAGAGGGFDFGAACSSVIVVLRSQQAVDHFCGAHVKVALDAQACAGPLGRAAESAVNVTPTEAGNDLDARQFAAYGTSEGLFAGAGAHATWVAVRDAQNEEYYRRTMAGADILSAFGHDAGEMGRRHPEIFRLQDALHAAARGVVAAGGIVGGADTDSDDLLIGDSVAAMGVAAIGGVGVVELADGVALGAADASLKARRSEFARRGSAEARGTPF